MKLKSQILPATFQGQKPILFDLYHGNSQNLVIFCHGYKGYKDWGAWHLVADYFYEHGISFLKFNFSHNGGTVNQPIDFPDLDAFAENNYSIEMEDLSRVIEYSNENGYQNIHLIGHSRGGAIVLQAALEQKIQSVTTWNAVHSFDRFPKGEKFEKWKKNGVFTVLNGRTKQEMPHDFQFFEDYQRNLKRFSLHNNLSLLKCPLLICHAELDPAVSVQSAHKIERFVNNSTLVEKFILSGSDHVFGSKHPWEQSSLPSDLEIICRKTIEFINQ